MRMKKEDQWVGNIDLAALGLPDPMRGVALELL
jgi:hypothetical protein